MEIKTNIALLEEILEPFKKAIGTHFQGYRNHCYRIIHLCCTDKPFSADEFEKIVIASAFHDLGLFTNNSLDYLPSSTELAKSYLKEVEKSHFSYEISLIIDLHHKVTSYQGKYDLVETFRKADLADFSLGLITSGISSNKIKSIKQAFPNKGFHKMLVLETIKWLIKYPFRRIPIFKW